MKKKQKRQLIRIAVSGILFLCGTFLPLPDAVSVAVLMGAYLAAGYDTLLTAIRNIRHGQVFDENFLMTIATVGALCLQDYKEAVFVMLFYLAGTVFEEYAVNKSRDSISSLLDIRPDYANLLCGDTVKTVDPYDVSVGDIIVIKPGERVPLDGSVIEGHSTLDTSALTGESLPADINCGDEISSGCINLTGVLKVRVSSEFDDSTVARILEMVENAGSRKAKAEKFITRFARYYTPVVVIAAVILALVPPLFIAGHPFGDWISRALIFLVISCPCALVISVPLAFFGGIGGASSCGILVKGSNYLEVLANVDTIIFDKTGTLTTGTFHVKNIFAAYGDTSSVLDLAAHAEIHSSHPLSVSIREHYGRIPDQNRVSDVQELAGKGIYASVDGTPVYAGNARLMKTLGFTDIYSDETATLVHIATADRYLGAVVLTDTLKSDSASAISDLKSIGVRQTVMLTGDRSFVASNIAETIGLDQFHAELMPADKVTIAEKIIKEKSSRGSVIFAGDGINDAPVLARADAGVAMGGLGSQAAIEASDIVIMDDKPSKLAVIIRIARKTLGIARQNVIFALAVKFAILVLGTVGLANMWLAVFADVGVAVICILNSMRCLKVKKLI